MRKKAVFVPIDQKKDAQVIQDMALTPQQRVDRMFELIETLIHLQKDYTLPPRHNCITLHRKHGSL